MTTIGEALGHLQQELFVGREPELATLRAWLASDQPRQELLLVVGRGGIGKSALLRRLAREVLAAGRPVILLDCQRLGGTPAGLLRELGYPDLPAAVAALNQLRPLLMLDGIEEAAALHRFLAEELLPVLDSAVRVILAGRVPSLPFAPGDLGTPFNMRMMTLSPFSHPEIRKYLRQRGLTDRALQEQITAATAGNPLAVSLAADLVIHLDLRDFGSAPEWNLAVQALVERLLQDVQDPQLRDLLYAGAVVRQFDAATLAALTDQAAIDGAFRQLCRLAVVRAAEHGLMLHGDIRKILLRDLRWRSPGQYERLRNRAVAYYLGRLRSASPAMREWLLTEIFFLWEDGLIHSLAFGEEDSGELWLEPGRPVDYDQIRRIWHWSLRRVLAPAVGGMAPNTGEEPMLEAVLQYPEIRLRVVRDRTGRLLGFAAAVPICKESLPFFELWGALMPLVNAYVARQGRERLPRTPAEGRAYFLTHLVHGEVMAERVEAALFRDALGFFSGGGVYLIAAPLPKWKQFATALGFELVPEARIWVNGPAHPIDGYILDLTQSGVEPWLESIMQGRPFPRPLTSPELERELKAVLAHWHDDGFLARSPLAHYALLSGPNGEAVTPDGLRTAIRSSLKRAARESPAAVQNDLQTLELAYLHRSDTHEQTAHRLNVSRATYYRMLERGVRELAAWMGRE